MAQSYTTPTTADSVAAACTQSLPDAIEAVRTKFSGASAPSATTPYQDWADTTTGALKIRNAGDSAFVAIAPLASDWAERTIPICERASFGSGSLTFFVAPPSADAIVRRVTILSDTATTSTSGNEWQLSLANVTDGGAALFSGTVGTYTTLGGVGGGELAADTTYVLTPDQNATISADDCLEFTFTATGSVTALVRLSAWIEWSTTGV